MTAPEPKTEEFKLLGRDDTPLQINGRLLGFASSRRDIHTHDDVFTNDTDIEAEIAAWEEHLVTQPRRLAEAAATKYRTTITEYLNELADDEYPKRYAPPGDRCSACRWFEVRIFEVDSYKNDNGAWVSGDKYLVLTCGLSDVPGEVAKRRAHWTNSPFAVLEALTQRRGSTAFLPATSARVLAEAAAVDADIADAYVNRAVA